MAFSCLGLCLCPCCQTAQSPPSIKLIRFASHTGGGCSWPSTSWSLANCWSRMSYPVLTQLQRLVDRSPQLPPGVVTQSRFCCRRRRSEGSQGRRWLGMCILDMEMAASPCLKRPRCQTSRSSNWRLVLLLGGRGHRLLLYFFLEDLPPRTQSK